MSYDLSYAAVMLYKSDEKRASDAELSYGLKGKLVLSKSGWILLHVPNALVRGAFDALHEPGTELPNGPDLNAHISVMSPSDVEAAGGAHKITERGHEFAYTLGPVKTVQPSNWEGISRVWYLTVVSPELQSLRKSYGLSPRPRDNQFDFHITIGVRKKHVLNDNPVTKVTPGTRTHRDSGVFKLERHEIKMPQSSTDLLQKLWGSRHTRLQKVATQLPGIPGRYGSLSSWINARPKR